MSNINTNLINLDFLYTTNKDYWNTGTSATISSLFQ